MQAGDMATWVGSASAVFAAVASGAVWRRQQTDVLWKLEPWEQGRSAVVNVGTASAKYVRVRLLSYGQTVDVEELPEVERLAPNEVIRITDKATYGAPRFVVEVTWRTRPGRRGRWAYETG